MNEKTKQLAKQAGFYKYGDHFEEIIERFAALIRADEREVCAKLCENVVSNQGYVQAKYCADAIRTMGDAVEQAVLKERAEVLMALDSDLEHGVKWLSEKACAEFKKNCPELNRLLNSWGEK